MFKNLEDILSKISFGDALIVVDPENDFFPGGALGVDGGDEIIDPINRLMSRFSATGLPIFITKDWHPSKTKHFAKYGGNWPVHCVQNTWGAELHPGLKVPKESIVLLKGLGDDDDYSGFHARDDHGNSLQDLLHREKTKRLIVCGLAEDVCVKFTVLVGREKGFEVILPREATRSVNINPGDDEKAVAEMRTAGAIVV